MVYNKLLLRQIRRKLKHLDEIPEEFQAIFQAISESYDHYEKDRNLTERSLEVSSRELNDANKELNDANKLIQQAKDEIELKNQHIMASIRYAKKIQEAILPTENLIRSLLDDSFILFKPKDVVSGDFYWVEQKNDMVLMAAVDCTGHGVPGAFMSMIGNALLNEIVKEKGVTQASEVLNLMRDGVISSLRQTGEIGEAKDGMDISLCILDLKNNVAQYAGAYNPLYIIRKNSELLAFDQKPEDDIRILKDEHYSLIEFKANKFPIAMHPMKNEESFKHIDIPLQKGDSVYLFTDGYADQFGGPRNKKYKYSKLKELLLGMQDKAMSEQKMILENSLEEWKAGQTQIDDICILGTRV